MARILCPVLVGRDDELAVLDGVVEAGRAGRGGVVFVTGPAGIGKSRLLGEVAVRAQARGMTVLLGRSVPSQIPVPYRPVAEALVAAPAPGARLESAELAGFAAALGWIVPAWRGTAPAAPAESPIVVAEALLRALQVIATTRGCLLCLEDLQWADPETLHAVEYLADHATSSPVVCICTIRDEPGAEALEMATRLDARRGAERVELRPLELDRLLEVGMRSLGAGELAPEVAGLLRDSAEGIPFLAEELLAAAVTSGSLVRSTGGWEVTAPVRAMVPQSFASTVRSRLDVLDAAGRRFLGAAALLGRRFDWRLAGRAAGLTTEATHGVLEQATALQLLVAGGEQLSFRHALTREAVVAGMLPNERAELASRCLDALVAEPPSGDDWRHLAADLAETCAEPGRAAALLLEAGRVSLGRGALDTAAAALERAAGLAADPALRADILEALAEARSSAGDLRGTRAAVEALLDALAGSGAAPSRRGQAHLLLARCAVTASRFEVASEELARARRLAAEPEAPALAARVAAVAAQLSIGEGRLGEAEALAVRAAAQAEATGQAEVVCEALEVASRCARTRDLDEALEIGRRALQAAEDAGLALWRMRALYQIGVVEMFASGRVETLMQARAEAEALGAVATAASLDLEITAGLEAQHRIDEALATCARCIAMARTLDLGTVEAVAHAFQAILAAGRGARREMEDSIARVLSLAGENSELVSAVWGDGRAIASLVEEDRARARRELEHAVSMLTSSSSAVPRLAAALLPLIVCLDGDQPDFSKASGVTALNAQAAGYLDYAHAVQLGREGRYDAAVEAARRGDAHLAEMPWYRHLMHRLAAEAAIADDWGDPVSWLTDAAAYFDEAGSERLASACRALLRRAGVRVARPTRARRSLPPALRDAGVTPREAEVLALVGEGLANAEIAERLFLSARTVEQHVGTLKQKLEVRSRAQLAVYAAAELRAAR